MAVKTYILTNSNKLGFGVTLKSGIRRQVNFSGTTPHNQRSCGTYQTGDEETQQILEKSPMFGKVYELYMTDEGKVAIEPPKDDEGSDVKDNEDLDTKDDEGSDVKDNEDLDTKDDEGSDIKDNEDLDTKGDEGLDIVEVENWGEAKKYMVEHFKLAVNYSNSPEMLEKKATELGLTFKIKVDQ